MRQMFFGLHIEYESLLLIFLKGTVPKKLYEINLNKHHPWVKKPDYMDTWIVRISPKNKTACRDWLKLEEQSKTHTTVTWDKDFRNKIKVGDEIGFIVGEVGNETVHFYNITGDLPVSNRSSQWSDETYTASQSIKHDLSKREVIILDINTRRSVRYDLYKRSVGYKEKYTPRSTIKARRYFF